jgi:hypothetical protein
MKCNTRSGRIVREETRKERLTRPSNFVISPLSEGPILKCDFTLQRLARACKRIYLTAFFVGNPRLYFVELLHMPQILY